MRQVFYDLNDYLEQQSGSFYYDSDFDIDALFIEIKAFAAAFEWQVQ